ncbi:MAG: ankyrin repeat domain-containing protein [Deltaproteobacteria bacterium]|nr:ankyrin repeat domain-containing protein [Deltaproteobacteria bacterium]
MLVPSKYTLIIPLFISLFLITPDRLGWAQGQPAAEAPAAEGAAEGEAEAYVAPVGNEWVELCGTAGEAEIKRALGAGADPNYVSQGGLTPLLSAAAFNRDVGAVGALLDAGANIEAVENRFGLNALMLAASHNPMPEMIDFLISKGISIDYQNFQGGTALIQAASSNPNPAVTEALIKAGAKVNAPDSLGATPLMHAAGYGKTPVIRKLLEKGADVSLVDEAGDAAISWAARSNVDSGAIFELLKAKADPKARNLRGLSPLYHAAVNPNSDVLAVLLEATGNDLGLLDAPEGSALFAAAYFNPNVNVARRLLSLGAKADQAHVDGMTILMASLLNPEPAMTKLILSQRVDPNETDSYGRTALMLAAAVSRDPVVVRLLLGAGADLALKDKDGLTAFDYAGKNDNEAVAGLFKSIAEKGGGPPAAEVAPAAEN